MSAQTFPAAIPLSAVEQFLAGHFVPVTSTYCVAIAYRADTSAIRIRYDDGRTGNYFPFDRNAALSFFYAPSKGRWAWKFIRVAGTKHDHHCGFAYG